MKTKFNGILTLLLAFVVHLSFAQEKTISGTVTDTSGSLPGVSVLIKGTTKGTETDFDGKYSIKAKTGDVLVFSYLGYKKTEKTVGSSNVINVKMTEDSSVLDEVIVTGYTSKANRAMTGSITTLKSETIENATVSNFAEALQGQSAGLQSVSSSGQPGSRTSIRIRGTGSVNGNKEPLYVIDGVPLYNVVTDLGGGALDSSQRDPLSNLNQNDIESVTILKDASSTSIYGARGANGIILITTKKGKNGKAKFRYTGYTGISARTTNNFEVLNASEFIELRREGMINSGVDPAIAVLNVPDTNVDTKWEDYAFADWKAITKSHNFSVSQGNDKTRFYLSLGYLNQDGIVIGSGLERMSTRLNLDSQASDKIKVGMGFSYSRSNQKTAFTDAAYFASPVVGTYLFHPTMEPYLEDGTPNFNNPVTGGTSFIADRYYNKEESVTDRVIGNMYAQIKVTNEINFKTSFGGDLTHYNYTDYTDPRNNNNPGTASRVNFQAYNWNFVNTLTWDKDFGESHSLSVLLGQEITYEFEDILSVTGESFPVLGLTTIGQTATVTFHSSGTEESSLESYFLNANYGYDNKIHLNLTLRRDASSVFGPNNKWGTFWAVGANWVLTEEEFLSDVTWLNSLKLKGSTGVQGNLPDAGVVGRYPSFGLNANDSYNGLPSTFPATAPNPDLKWEEQQLYTVGVEFGLFDRLTGSIDYYSKKTKDLLFRDPLPPNTGYNDVWKNSGDMTNKGIEVAFNLDIFKNTEFKWNVGANITFNKNEVTFLKPTSEGPSGIYIRQVGSAWNTFYLREWAGVDPANGDPLWYDDNGNLTSNYNSAGLKEVGSADPDFYGGFTTAMSYKNFSLNALFSYQYGNEIYNNTSRITSSDGAFANFNQSRDQLDRWQNPGDIALNPRRVDGNSSQSNQASTRWLEDGSFLRLKNVRFAYNIDSNVLNNTFISKAIVYVQGQNLLTFTNFKGLDPEQSLDGQHWFAYPNSRTVSIGVDISF